MRIIIIRPNAGDFGKIGSYNVQEVGLAKALISNGHEVRVLYTHKKVKALTKDSNYDFVFYIPRIKLGLHGIFSMRWLESFNPERVIVFSDNQLWAKNIIDWCNKNNIICINYFGGVLSNNPRFINQIYTKLILKRNVKSYKKSYNIAKTNEVKNEMEMNSIHCNRVVHVGLDTTILAKDSAINYHLRTSMNYTTNDKIILFIGRLVDYKMPLFACNIILKLKKRNNNFKLIIIGKGPLENDLIRHIAQNNLEDNVRYLRHVPYSKIHQYMVISDVLINLSEREIFGMTIIEGMFYGNAVVAHKAPGPNDIIVSGVDGILLDNYNLDDWAIAVENAVDKRKYYATNSKKSILDKFTWDVVSEQFIQIGE